MNQHRKIILASGSPRRKDYLEKFRLQFQVFTGQVDESVRPGESPNGYARRMAVEKSEAVVSKSPLDSVIISADTIVVFDGAILGKPAGREQIMPMLQMLNGQIHEVMTAYRILDLSNQQDLIRLITTTVQFNHLEAAVLEAYANSDEPLDKAGAYSIQGLGTILVQSIAGSYNNVVGLPIEVLFQDLLKMEVITAKGNT